MLNILHINSYAQAGGAEQVACDLLNNPWVSSKLLVKSHASADPRIQAIPAHVSSRVYDFLDRVVRKLGFNNQFKILFSLAEQGNFTYSRLRQTQAYQQADLIHLHNLHGNYFDLMALAQIAREKPVVWTLHDMWPMTGGEFYTYGNLNYQQGIGKTPIRYLAPLQDPLLDLRQQHLERKKKLYRQLAHRLTFVPVSYWLEEAFKQAYVFDPSLQVRTIYNGVDTNIFYNQHLRTWPKPRLLFFNASGESKASHLFREILPALPAGFELYVVGQPLEHPSVVYHRPFIREREALHDLYNQVDLLVFPSKAETFGLVPLEAMACGVCVITSTATALPEVVNPQVGMLFESENPADLLHKVSVALAHLPQSRALGARAAVYAQDTFTLSKTHERYFQLYQEAIQNFPAR
ncbi:glycosyltransferase [Rufibacter quisquiliarum]|uniref:Glycosyltransferase involved in cell wall biosynthesis n=1 Tax=Rufibacter quisquiliarum TaxID=1549639 RepID=A0A839GM93_9BACT|nr:glycosyltransferase [Rufibacter quisquiliarum]MBA9079840.1 glycosyltransferase involved in cell wall biosynthesis [Rufibacter quisquiliarum]